jgi:hypothetical protein
MYACGFKLGPAATLNQNPNFEKTSKTTNKKGVWYYDKS